MASDYGIGSTVLMFDPNEAIPELSTVLSTWELLLPEFPPATRGAISGAVPVGIDADALIFGVAPELFHVASFRFKKIAENVSKVLAKETGFNFRILLQAGRYTEFWIPDHIVQIDTLACYDKGELWRTNDTTHYDERGR